MAMPPAYTIVLMDIHDIARYKQYRALALPTLERHGFELIGNDRTPEVLEGSVFGRQTGILRWPSKAAAMEWYRDPEYQQAKRMRDEAATSDLVIVDGLDPAPTIGTPTAGNGAPGYSLTLIDVHDRDGYKAYAKLAFPIMERYGCEVLVDDRQPEVLEGNVFGSRTILLKWASRDAALKWYRDPDYVEATKLRLAATDSRLMVLDGAAPA
jgi:uncharacterized protein (DUF1330 family)